MIMLKRFARDICMAHLDAEHGAVYSINKRLHDSTLHVPAPILIVSVLLSDAQLAADLP